MAIKQLLYFLEWLKILKSPFRFPRPHFYFGPIKRGVPYFLPRRWIKSSEDQGHLVPKYIKWFGAGVVGLGWKEKYGTPRHEWDPMLWIVLCKRQFVVTFSFKDPDSWECYLTYQYYTDPSKSREERLIEAKKLTPGISTWYNGHSTIVMDWFTPAVKKRYRKYL